MAQQLNSSEILDHLKQRLEKTNYLYKKMNEDDVEYENVIFFKYFFDLSTVIESTIRGIVYEQVRLSIFPKYLLYVGEPSSDRKAFMVNFEELDALLDAKFTVTYILEDFEIYKQHIIALENYHYNFTIDRSIVIEKYKRIRKIRNHLAHGLLSTTTIDFTKETLSDFVFIFYYLHKYYITIESMQIMC